MNLLTKPINSLKNFVCAVGENTISLISKVDWANVKVDTYIRYALMLLSLVNMALTHFGKNPIPYSEEKIYSVLSDIFTGLIMVVNTYKDNPTSKESIEYTKMQRVEKTSEDLEEIQKLLEEKLEEIKQLNEVENEDLDDESDDIDEMNDEDDVQIIDDMPDE